jgi:hypothetical protein
MGAVVVEVVEAEESDPAEPECTLADRIEIVTDAVIGFSASLWGGWDARRLALELDAGPLRIFRFRNERWPSPEELDPWMRSSNDWGRPLILEELPDGSLRVVDVGRNGRGDACGHEADADLEIVVEP